MTIIHQAIMVSINKMAIMAFIAWLHMAMNTTNNGVCKEQENCRSEVKADLKNMHRFKSYGQNKIDYEIMAISFIFWAYF